jgi:hypothetical protein
MGVWFFVHSLSGSKWGRFFVAVLPAFLLLAGCAVTRVLDRVAPPTRAAAPPAGGHRAFRLAATRPLVIAVLATLVVGGEARAALSHAPHYRMYVNVFGGGDANITWYFPHCDLYDVGFREAVQQIAANAEPGAEISSEVDWLSRLYAERAGRPDIGHTLFRPRQGCRSGATCYAIVQPGRIYLHNAVIVGGLRDEVPWHTVRVRDDTVVTVYRFSPRDRPLARFVDGLGPGDRTTADRVLR